MFKSPKVYIMRQISDNKKEVVSTKGNQLLVILASCLAVLFVIIISIVIGSRDLDVLKMMSNAISDAFNVTSGSFAGWLALIIVSGIILIVIIGALALIKKAFEIFKE